MDGPNRLMDELQRRGVSRREFVRFCSLMAGVLALPTKLGAEIAKTLATVQKPTLVWMEFQGCTGDSESLLRASRPTVADIVLDVLSVDYHETIMAAAGTQATDLLHKTAAEKKGTYIAVVEGAIPAKDDGVYCMIGGRSALQIVREVCGNAAATIAIGSCAAYGGLPAAKPNPTGAMSVADAVPGIKNLINMPACPANVENLTATVVHYLTFKSWPALDAQRRPLFAYGKAIHDNCERRAHFDAGQYVEEWGDEGHRTGYCLYKMGCKGPVSFQNCPNVKWNSATNWPVGCGHPCIGCAEAEFWDKMTPFYRHLPGADGYGVHASIDKVGVSAAGVLAAGLIGHGIIASVRHHNGKKKEEREAAANGKAENGNGGAA